MEGVSVTEKININSVVEGTPLYVVLPSRFPSNMIEVLYSSSKEEFKCLKNSLNNYFPEKSLCFYHVRDCLIDKKWAENILINSGNEHHLNATDEYYYILYWAYLNRNIIYYFLERRLCELNPQYNSSVGCGQIIEFLEVNNYKVVIPPFGRYNCVSYNRLAYYKKKSLANYKYRRFVCTVITKAKSRFKIAINNKIVKVKRKLNQEKLRKDIENRLHNSQILDIKPISKINSSFSGAFFYTGSYKGSKIFIKAFDSIGGVKNEHEALAALKRTNGTSNVLCNIDFPFDSKDIIAYPFIDTQSLAEIIKERKLSPSEYEILVAFAYDVSDDLYKANVVHCDIRPENVLAIVENNVIVRYILIDFGVAATNGQWFHNKSFYAKDKMRFAGESFRYSEFVIDDCASLEKLLKICNPKWGEPQKLDNNFNERIGRLTIKMEE